MRTSKQLILLQPRCLGSSPIAMHTLPSGTRGERVVWGLFLSFWFVIVVIIMFTSYRKTH